MRCLRRVAHGADADSTLIEGWVWIARELVGSCVLQSPDPYTSLAAGPLRLVLRRVGALVDIGRPVLVFILRWDGDAAVVGSIGEFVIVHGGPAVVLVLYVLLISLVVLIAWACCRRNDSVRKVGIGVLSVVGVVLFEPVGESSTIRSTVVSVVVRRA